MNARATTVPVQHADRFFIGGEWVEPSSDATIDVIDSGTEEVYYSIAAAAPDDMSRAVAAARHAFDDGPWTRLTHAERAEYITRAGRRGRGARRRALAAVAARVGRALLDVAVRRADRLGCARGLRRAGRHVPVRGGVPADRRRQVRPARARAGRRGRRDHPVERAGRAHLPQDRPRAARRLHRRAQVGAGGAGRGLRVRRGGRADRPAAGRAQRRHRRPRSLGAARDATPASTRSRSRDRPRPAGASRRCAASASPGARSSSAGSRRRSSSTTWISGPRPRRSPRPSAGSTARCARRSRASSSRRVVTTSSWKRSPRASARPASATRSTRSPSSGRSSRNASATACSATSPRASTRARPSRPGAAGPADLDRGYYVEPTVFGNVDNGSAIGSEEIFGPVLAVIKADDEQDAVRIANDTIYGLNASVFTNDVDRARAVAQ